MNTISKANTPFYQENKSQSSTKKSKGTSTTKFNLNEITIGGVNQKELTQFTRQFATLNKAGLTILSSLDTMVDILKPGLLRKTLKTIIQDVEAGETLSNAMGKHPKVFDPLYTNMVKAGEVGGVLDTILFRLSEFREKSQQLQREVKAAMIYPVSVMIIAITIVTGLMIFIVPMFKEMFEDMGQTLPPLTLMLISFSDLIKNHSLHTLAFCILLYITYRCAKKIPVGEMLIDRVKLETPVFGRIIRKSIVSRFCRTLATLLHSGVSIVEALKILQNTAGNQILSKSILDIEDSVKIGENMAVPMKKSVIFDKMTVNMMDVGEQSGEVPEMLFQVSEHLDNETEALVKGLKSLIEPIMIVALGLIVGFIVIALFLPILQLINNL